MGKVIKFIKDNKDVLICYLGSKILFILVLLITQRPYAEVLGLFDAEHYRDIAQFGYYVDGVTVFFPVVPLLLRFTGSAGLIVINQIAYIASLYYLKRIVLKFATETRAVLVLALAAVSPLSLFTSIEYTEALFFFLTVTAFFLFTEDKLPVLTGLLLGLSVATRNTGSLLFFAVFAGMVMRAAGNRKDIKGHISKILLCFVPATMISLIYPVFLQIRFGNWKVFMDAQYDYWIRMRSDIFRTVYISLKVIFTDIYTFDGTVDTIILFKINEILSTGCLALSVLLIAREILRMRRQGKININVTCAVIYSVLFILAIGLTIRDPALDCPTASFYRYYASMFPLYLGLGRLNDKQVKISFAVTALITVLTSAVFVMGAYFY